MTYTKFHPFFDRFETWQLISWGGGTFRLGSWLQSRKPSACHHRCGFIHSYRAHPILLDDFWSCKEVYLSFIFNPDGCLSILGSRKACCGGRCIHRWPDLVADLIWLHVSSSPRTVTWHEIYKSKHNGKCILCQYICIYKGDMKGKGNKTRYHYPG